MDELSPADQRGARVAAHMLVHRLLRVDPSFGATLAWDHARMLGVGGWRLRLLRLKHHWATYYSITRRRLLGDERPAFEAYGHSEKASDCPIAAKYLEEGRPDGRSL